VEDNASVSRSRPLAAEARCGCRSSTSTPSAVRSSSPRSPDVDEDNACLLSGGSKAVQTVPIVSPGGWPRAIRWKSAMRALLDDAQVAADRALAMGPGSADEPPSIATGPRRSGSSGEQGRLDEIPSENWSRFHVALPTWRMALAFAYSELGREEDAQRELDQATEVDLAQDRRDLNWLVTAALLSEDYARLRDPARAARM
jgi:hypothetical protein